MSGPHSQLSVSVWRGARAAIGKIFDNRFIRPIKRSMIRFVTVRKRPRAILNSFYNLLNDGGKFRFYLRYAKIFRDRDGVRLTPGEWTVRFIDRRIRMPLRSSSSLWLDWDCAVSIIGHEMEIKQTYARLINSSERPALFLDVSANYGTHSALFLASGIATIAFEPNPGCFAYFRSVCELNGLNGRWEAVAIGNRGGEIELIYPEKETWLGSVASSAAAAMTASRSVIKQRVPMKRLDNFIGDMPRGKILVKIDVEGFEYEVIEGASQLIRDFRPTIIFESNTADKRSELFRLLSDHGCALRLLPWQPTSPVLSLDEFLTSAGTNFIAVAG